VRWCPSRYTVRLVPTVTLALSSIDFLRLGCGRVAPQPLVTSGAIAIVGDQSLGRQILESMNFMF
jgi:hypothetical protein